MAEATVPCTHRLPRALAEGLKELTRESGVSQNAFVVGVLSEAYERWKRGELALLLRDLIAERPGAPAFVYFVQSLKSAAAIKIGYTTNFALRLNDLRSLHGPLEPLLVLPGSRVYEQQLHAMFAHLRIEGEWFHPGDDLLAYIREKKAASTSHVETSRPAATIRISAEALDKIELQASARGVTVHTVIEEVISRILAEPTREEVMLTRMGEMLARLERVAGASTPPPGLSVMPSEPAVEALTVAPVALSERVATAEAVMVKVAGESVPAPASEDDAKREAIKNATVDRVPPLPAPPHVPRGMAPLPPREVEIDPTVSPLALPSDVEDLMDLLP